MKALILTLSLIFTINIVFSQITEDFNNDFNFQTSIWRTDSSKFTINPLEQLQLNDNQSGNAFITTEHGLNNFIWKEWSFQLRLNFSPSSGNYARVYLTSPDSILTSNSPGLFLQFGESGSGDLIRLIHQTSNTAELMTSPQNLINASFDLQLKISVDSLNFWRMSILDPSTLAYTIVDSAQYTLSNAGEYFGLYCQYTSSNATKFYWDNIYVGNIAIDTFPPKLMSFTQEGAKHFNLLFDELIDPMSLNDFEVKVDGTAVGYDSVVLNSTQTQVKFYLQDALENDSLYNFNLSGFRDELGNHLDTLIEHRNLYHQEAFLKDIIFNELMIDPSPAIGLPEREFIEIYNRSDKTVNLNRFKLVNEQDTFLITDFWLKPNSYVVLCDVGDTSFFISSLGLSNFPSLKNTADYFQLITLNNELIDELAYDASYYEGEFEAGDGRSLALIYPNYFCTGPQHWEGSVESSGGSPGFANEKVDYSFDTKAPQLLELKLLDSSSIQLVFNEQMDEVAIVGDTTLILENLLLESTWHNDKVDLKFEHPFLKNSLTSLNLSQFADCNGNFMDTLVAFIRPAELKAGDVIINEILFNPETGGSDYVELYNRSDKFLSLNGCFLGKSVSEKVQLVNLPLLAPGDYFYFSKDILYQQENFPFHGKNNGYVLNLPNFANDSGTVILFDSLQIIDVFHYDENMHFELLEDVNGVALERVFQTGDGAAWRSAGSTVNFGTPGTKNSQSLLFNSYANLEIEPKIITPNGDGEKDFTSIYYSQSYNQYMLTIKIYDENGLLVKTLKNNSLESGSGVVLWDGYSTEIEKIRLGNYIIIAEFLDLETHQLQVSKQILILSGN